MSNFINKTLIVVFVLSTCLLSLGAVRDANASAMVNEANEDATVNVPRLEIYGDRSAEDAAREWLQKMVSIGKLPHMEGCMPVKESLGGVTSNNLTCVVIGIAEAKVPDPSFDSTFVTQRSLWAVEAGLVARTRIIESMAAQITAMDVLELPDHPISKQFDQEIRELQSRIAQAKRALVPLLTNVDATLADQLEGVTAADRANALMDAAIRKLDETWNPENVEAAKQKRYENAKKAYLEAQAQLDGLEKEITKHKDTLKQETRSTVFLKSNMPLFGTTPVKTWESFDGETYQVAIVILWDAKSNGWAKAIASGEPTSASLSPGKKSFNEYLASKDWSKVILGRRMVDDKGQLYVMGVGAASLDSLTRREAETLANLQAQKNLVFSIFAEQDAESTAEIGTQIKGIGNQTTATTKANVVERLMSKVENRSIPGVTRVFSQTATHDLSGRDMFISVFMVTPENLQSAMDAYDDAAQTRADDRRSQQDIKDAYAEADAIASQPSAPGESKSDEIKQQLKKDKADAEKKATKGLITDDDDDVDW